MEAVIVKGSPEELARFFALRPDLSAPAQDGLTSAVPEEVREWFEEWAVRPPRRALFERLVSEALSWDGVRHRITRGRKGQTRFAGRIGFVRQGMAQAFGFIAHRGLLVLRLDKDTDLSGFQYAKRRNVSGRRFGVQIYVRNEEALGEAVQLLKQAYEAE